MARLLVLFRGPQNCPRRIWGQRFRSSSLVGAGGVFLPSSLRRRSARSVSPFCGPSVPPKPELVDATPPSPRSALRWAAACPHLCWCGPVASGRSVAA